MSYASLVQKLFQVNLFGGMKLGLDNMLQLQRLLHYPDQKFATIHVAGTNGKGSVVTKIASALEHSGYRVGLYTSPHLSCFRERIRINGEMISEAAVECLLTHLFHLTEQHSIPATFFELTTALALAYFAQEKVDIVVLETGLGGRLDATNIVSPLLSVITSISLDHTEVLGPTIEAIAQEKAGIIKPHVPVVIGPNVPFAVIEEKARKMDSPYFQVTESFLLFEEENRAIAKACLSQLSNSLRLSEQAIAAGLKAQQPCRFQQVSTSPPVLLDVGHNPDGLKHLFQATATFFPNQPLQIVFGLSKSKDIVSCLTILKERGIHFYPVEASNGRGVPVSDLKKGLEQLGITSNRISIFSNTEDSLKAALQEASSHHHAVVVCGSFFIMSQIRQLLGIQEPKDEWDMNERTSSQPASSL